MSGRQTQGFQTHRGVHGKLRLLFGAETVYVRGRLRGARSGTGEWTKRRTVSYDEVTQGRGREELTRHPV